MIKTEFKRIAKKENGKLSYKDQDISIGGGARNPKLIYILKIEHNGNEISIVNQTGTSFIANINARFPVTKQSLDFDLSTKPHLSTLFSKTKERFKVKSNNPNIAAFMRNNAGLDQLNALANDTSFSPSINGSYEKDGYILRSEYHLQFSNWTQAIEPFIQFYRSFLDEFGKQQ